MRSDYRLRSVETIEVPSTFGPDNERLTETLRIYEFIPADEEAENKEDNSLEANRS